MVRGVRLRYSRAMTEEDQPHILVVDDDTRLRELLRKYLAGNGFLVTTAKDAAEARAKLAGLAFDLLVLDIMMPGETGLELTESLRRERDLPILLLTARGEPDDRIAGLEAGADDYLAKPFNPRELLLRINSILRRQASRPADPVPPQPVKLGPMIYLPDRDELRAGEEVVRLTTAEAGLLRVLAASPGTIFSREELTERSKVAGNARTIDVQVTRLRRKIEPDPREPRYLHTVRGEGYVLRPDP
ncbi:two-component response transcriptional regulator (OmpR family) (plasmid) [Azospirillum baldaniorum]|uniref:Two-component response transcriptional regulator (OmpR family) n=2 Tax=Azospirillum baldaniorum TaxID=1064539 RepID=A0A9P1NNS4_9PROT|nr:two-component response transcriptional regulator (OmpR family) [Azospirillum baldaniorum]